MNAQEEETIQGQDSKKKVLIVDDHPIFRLGLAGLIPERHHLESLRVRVHGKIYVSQTS